MFNDYYGRRCYLAEDVTEQLLQELSGRVQALETLPDNRELLFSLIERVELSEDKQIWVKFRFKQPESDCVEANF